MDTRAKLVMQGIAVVVSTLKVIVQFKGQKGKKNV